MGFESVLQSRASLVGNHFLYSHDPNVNDLEVIL